MLQFLVNYGTSVNIYKLIYNLDYFGEKIGILKNDECFTNLILTMTVPSSQDTDSSSIKGINVAFFNNIPNTLNSLEKINYVIDEIDKVIIPKNCSSKILDTLHWLTCLFEIRDSLHAIYPEDIQSDIKPITATGTVNYELTERSSTMIKEDIESTYITNYLINIKSIHSNSINVEQLTALDALQHQTSNSSIPIDSQRNVLIGTQGIIFFNKDIKDEIVSAGVDFFIDMSPSIINRFLKRIVPNDYSLAKQNRIIKKINDTESIFTEELTRMINAVSFDVNTGVFKFPIWMEYFGSASAGTPFTKRIFIELYGNIIARLIIYYSITIAKKEIYDIYNFRFIPMPINYKSTDIITFPSNILNTSSNISVFTIIIITIIFMIIIYLVFFR